MNPTLLQTLAWSLLHFLWQGAAIAAIAAALLLVCRRPAIRYLVGLGALASMLAAFGITFSLLNGAELPAVATVADTAAAQTAPAGPAPVAMPAQDARAGAAVPFDFTWLARAWLAGVFILAMRVAFGLFVIERLRRRNLAALPDALVARFHELQARLGLARGIGYAQCTLVSVPAVIGFFRPVVLLPVRALTGLSPEQLEALVAHELGHIKRWDVAVNFLQVLTETLFFFHPAVWWLNKRIRADREDCCDDIAVSAGGSPVGYARTLATIVAWSQKDAGAGRDVPHFAMAATGSPVAARVARLLGMSGNASPRTAGVFTASLVLAGALMAGAASLAAADVSKPVEPPVAPVSAPAPAMSAAPVAIPDPPAPKQSRAAAPAPAPAARPAPAPMSPAGTTSRPGGRYLDEMRAALGELDVDEIIALKVHGVTPGYVQQVRALGFEVDADTLVAFKVHDVTAEYVQQVRGMGFHPDADAIVAMKVQGVTPAYARQMRELGLEFDADELVALRVHGVTPEYVQRMRGDGFALRSTDEVIAMKVHDVTPEYRRTLESAGYRLDADELVHAKVMHITPEFIREAASHGFKDLSLEQLIALKNADVL